MNDVLKRKLFNLPTHDHRGTGIASGLEYRPGYKVGGRVGFDFGGPVPHSHPHVTLDPWAQEDMDPKTREPEDFGRGKSIHGGPQYTAPEPDFGHGPERIDTSEAEAAMQGLDLTGTVTEGTITKPTLTTNIGMSSLGKDKDFIDRVNTIEDMISEATEDIDYSKYAPTTGEVLTEGMTTAYDKLYGTPIAAGTLGKPSVVGTYVNEIAKAANAASATRKELDLMGETEKKKDKVNATEKALDLAQNIYATDLASLDARQKNEIAASLGISAQQLDKYIAEGGWNLSDIQNKRQVDLGYATLENEMSRAFMNANIDLKIANIQAMAPTAEMKNFGELLELKNEDGSAMFEPGEAMSMAFKTQNSQLDFGAALIGALTAGIDPLDGPEGAQQAVLQAFGIMQSMFGDSLKIDIDQLNEMLQTPEGGGTQMERPPGMSDEDWEEFQQNMGMFGNE